MPYLNHFINTQKFMNLNFGRYYFSVFEKTNYIENPILYVLLKNEAIHAGLAKYVKSPIL